MVLQLHLEVTVGEGGGARGPYRGWWEGLTGAHNRGSTIKRPPPWPLTGEPDTFRIR